MTFDNIVPVGSTTQHCRLGLFQDSDFAGTLRTQNQPQEESYVSLELEHLSPSVGCARSERQYPTVLQNRKSCRWMLNCEWMDYLLSIYGMWWVKCCVLTTPRRQVTSIWQQMRVTSCFEKHIQTQIVMKELRSTNNTARQGRLAQGTLCGTGDHSINKTMTKIPTEKSKRDVDQLSHMDKVPTNAHSSQGESQLYT